MTPPLLVFSPPAAINGAAGAAAEYPTDRRSLLSPGAHEGAGRPRPRCRTAQWSGASHPRRPLLSNICLPAEQPYRCSSLQYGTAGPARHVSREQRPVTGCSALPPLGGTDSSRRTRIRPAVRYPGDCEANQGAKAMSDERTLDVLFRLIAEQAAHRSILGFLAGIIGDATDDRVAFLRSLLVNCSEDLEKACYVANDSLLDEQVRGYAHHALEHTIGRIPGSPNYPI